MLTEMLSLIQAGSLIKSSMISARKSNNHAVNLVNPKQMNQENTCEKTKILHWKYLTKKTFMVITFLFWKFSYLQKMKD